MRNQAFRKERPERGTPSRRLWSWLVPSRTPDPDVIDLAAYRRRREEQGVSAGGRPKGGAA